MNYLLDRFAAPAMVFRPSSAGELFSFRLAQKLGDAQAMHHYLRLADSNPQEKMLCAYRRIIRASGSETSAKRFHWELGRIHSTGHLIQKARLLSIRVERRTVAAAIFAGDHLEFTDAKQLSSVHEKAMASAIGFINWLMQHFTPESAVIEVVPNGHEFQRRTISDTIRRALRERGLPIWEVPKVELLEGYGYPALKFREELRQIATTIWPVIAGTHSKVLIQDAAVLGLYVQIERLFIIN